MTNFIGSFSFSSSQAFLAYFGPLWAVLIPFEPFLAPLDPLGLYGHFWALLGPCGIFRTKSDRKRSSLK